MPVGQERWAGHIAWTGVGGTGRAGLGPVSPPAKTFIFLRQVAYFLSQLFDLLGLYGALFFLRGLKVLQVFLSALPCNNLVYDLMNFVGWDGGLKTRWALRLYSLERDT